MEVLISTFEFSYISGEDSFESRQEARDAYNWLLQYHILRPNNYITLTL